jgi:hypothetical protein
MAGAVEQEAAKVFPLLEAATKQRICEDMAIWEDFECTVVIYR